jgi:hypothetical protein
MKLAQLRADCRHLGAVLGVVLEREAQDRLEALVGGGRHCRVAAAAKGVEDLLRLDLFCKGHRAGVEVQQGGCECPAVALEADAVKEICHL